MKEYLKRWLLISCFLGLVVDSVSQPIELTFNTGIPSASYIDSKFHTHKAFSEANGFVNPFFIGLHVEKPISISDRLFLGIGIGYNFSRVGYKDTNDIRVNTDLHLIESQRHFLTPRLSISYLMDIKNKIPLVIGAGLQMPISIYSTQKYFQFDKVLALSFDEFLYYGVDIEVAYIAKANNSLFSNYRIGPFFSAYYIKRDFEIPLIIGLKAGIAF